MQMTKQKKELNPFLKLALELGPLVVYFWSYKHYAETPLTLFGHDYYGIVAATVIFTPLMLLTILVSYILTRHLPRMSVFTTILVVVFGGLTIWLDDETFTKLRPTIIYGLEGGALAFGLYVHKKSYLKSLMGESMAMKDEGWMLFTRNFVIFFVVMVIINEITRRFLSDGAWVFLDSFGQFGLTLLFMATQIPILMKYADEDALADKHKG